MSISPLAHTVDLPWHEQIAALPLTILYKHSPTCELSGFAMHEMKQFVAENADIPVFMVDVLSQRSLSNHVEAHLQIRHESPQAIILQHGKPVWNASHRRVTSPGLSNALRDLATST